MDSRSISKRDQADHCANGAAAVALSLSVVGTNFITACVVMILFFAGLWHCRRNRALCFWFLWIVLPLGLVAGLDIFRGTYALAVIRYTLPISAGVCGVVSICSHELFSRRGWVAPAVLACICAAGLPWAYPPPPQWKIVAAALKRDVRAGSIMVFTGGPTQPLNGVDYMAISHYAPDLPASVVLMTDVRQQIFPSVINSGRPVWFFSFQANESPATIFPPGQIRRLSFIQDVGWVCELQPKKQSEQ
jgi:hypothetical protein